MSAWFVYLIECTDGSLYCGIAIDVDKRYAAHASGKGAKYTRSRRPRRLVLKLRFRDRSAAARAEYRLKRLPVALKRELPGMRPAAIRKLL